MLAKVIWDFETFKIIGILLAGAIFWVVFAVRFGKAIDSDVNDFMNPFSDLPDEITVEIVKEKPAAPVPSSTSQTASSPLPSTVQAAASDDASGPKEKRVYLPE